jgi:large subunit ribosomal protein L30
MLQALRNIWDVPDLRKLHQVVERQDTPMVRGMIRKIPHLVAVVE